MIKNKITGKMYIGQTIRKNLYDRWRQHKSCKKDTVGNYLYNSYIKYGIHNFDYKLVCICFDEDCNKFEEDYIKKYNSIYPNGYNLKPGGNNHKLSEETKQLQFELHQYQTSLAIWLLLLPFSYHRWFYLQFC